MMRITGEWGLNRIWNKNSPENCLTMLRGCVLQVKKVHEPTCTMTNSKAFEYKMKNTLMSSFGSDCTQVSKTIAAKLRDYPRKNTADNNGHPPARLDKNEAQNKKVRRAHHHIQEVGKELLTMQVITQ